jgi:hypothetical protein
MKSVQNHLDLLKAVFAQHGMASAKELIALFGLQRGSVLGRLFAKLRRDI